MATVLDVAKYVISRCGEMTAMKLEKLVYYCQAWSLGWDNVPLFDEEFEAWANGPVCPQLFNAHKGLFTVHSDFFDALPDYAFTESELETMNSVIDYYGDKEPQWLSELTHKEAPWKEARKGVPDGASCNNIVTKDSMLQYYGGLDG
jgi:uncharacterized phage-associated protein